MDLHPRLRGDEAKRGRLPLLQAWKHPEVLPGSCSCKKTIAHPEWSPSAAAELFVFSPFWVLLSLSSPGQPGAAFEPEIPAPSDRPGYWF